MKQLFLIIASAIYKLFAAEFGPLLNLNICNTVEIDPTYKHKCISFIFNVYLGILFPVNYKYKIVIFNFGMVKTFPVSVNCHLKKCHSFLISMYAPNNKFLIKSKILDFF